MASCIICNGNSTEMLFEKNAYKIVRCRNDGHVYVSNPPILEELVGFYDLAYFQGKKESGYHHNVLESQDKHFRKAERNTFKLFKLMEEGKILDVGCGPGFFIEIASGLFDVKGCDLSKVAANYAKEKFGSNIWVGDFLDYPEIESYDAITMFGYLEHTLDPRENLRKANSLLKKGGLLMLTLPNVDGFTRHLRGINWRGFSFPEHIHLINEPNLIRLLEETCFSYIQQGFLENNFFRESNYFYAVKKDG